MSQAYAFEIPYCDAEIAARLIESVPPDWSWIDGQVDAPLKEVAEGLVARAGYKICRFDSIAVVTLNEEGERNDFFHFSSEQRTSILMYRREAKLALVGLGLMPLFVRFDEAGFDQQECGDMPFESAKRIASEYVCRGYLGDLFFRSDCYDNCGSYNPERCDIHLAPYTARWHRMEGRPPVIPFSELEAAYKAGNRQRIKDIKANNDPPKAQFPALIKIEWEKKYGGRPERIAGILDACRELGLKELDPEPIEYGTSYAE
ncbi:MAG TPA: hypothetical protein VNA68_00700 [Candidatus Dormibacteraeota bacterium]|nr:hypothetical protein [Candidatus Dormibacteraeota bacterium]